MSFNSERNKKKGWRNNKHHVTVPSTDRVSHFLLSLLFFRSETFFHCSWNMCSEFIHAVRKLHEQTSQLPPIDGSFYFLGFFDLGCYLVYCLYANVQRFKALSVDSMRINYRFILYIEWNFWRRLLKAAETVF